MDQVRNEEVLKTGVIRELDDSRTECCDGLDMWREWMTKD